MNYHSPAMELRAPNNSTPCQARQSRDREAPAEAERLPPCCLRLPPQANNIQFVPTLKYYLVGKPSPFVNSKYFIVFFCIGNVGMPSGGQSVHRPVNTL